MGLSDCAPLDAFGCCVTGFVPSATQLPAAPGFLEPQGRDAFVGSPGFQEMKRQLVLDQMQRVASAMEARGEVLEPSTRGSRHAIICFTMLDPADPGRLRRFISVSQAAKSVGKACDNVCQAIRRQGTCGGHRFGYVSSLPECFNEYDAVAALRLHHRQRPEDHGRVIARMTAARRARAVAVLN